MVERPGVLRIGDRVVFAGAEQSVVAFSGSSVRLVAESGESTVVALAYLLGAEDFAVVGAGPGARVAPLGLLDVLPEKVAADARTWERHLIEVESGLAPDAAPGTAPRPEYDPVRRSLTQREAAKATELGKSLRTVGRMRRRYHEQGIWGLVDVRFARRAKPTGNVPADGEPAGRGGPDDGARADASGLGRSPGDVCLADPAPAPGRPRRPPGGRRRETGDRAGHRSYRPRQGAPLGGVPARGRHPRDLRAASPHPDR